MSKSPLVSFVVLSFNYEKYIRDTIESILSQSYENIELIIVDDGSSDNSVKILQSIEDPRVRILYNQVNLGARASFARAIEHVAGDWIAVVDSDDKIDTTRTQICLDYLDRNPEIDVMGTWVIPVDADGASSPDLAWVSEWFNQEFDFSNLDNWLARNHLCHSSTMVRAKLRKDFEPADATLARTGDYYFWTSILRRGAKFMLVPQRLTYMRVHPGGVTHGDPFRAFLEISYIVCKNVVPTLIKEGKTDSWYFLIDWWCNSPQVEKLDDIQFSNIFAQLLKPRVFKNFAEFQEKTALRDAYRRPLLRSKSHRDLATRIRNGGLFSKIPPVDTKTYLQLSRTLS
jgi:glycosyltransferase involved in cell wall biosynthesis